MNKDPAAVPVPDVATDMPGTDETSHVKPVKEIGGPKEADPTRYGDWTVKGRCIDF